MCVIMGVSPYGCCVETKKLWDPQGISSSNVIVLIADHSHTSFAWKSQGITLEIAIKVHYIKFDCGDKSDDTAF